MRWYVSIGVVLVAGVLAGGDVAGFAAPNLRTGQASADVAGRQLADKEANPTVDVELVLAVDVSYSMDMDELALQREGYAQAIVSKEFLQALKTGPNGRIAVTYFEWAASTDQKLDHPLARDRRARNRPTPSPTKSCKRRSAARRAPRSRARSISPCRCSTRTRIAACGA